MFVSRSFLSGEWIYSCDARQAEQDHQLAQVLLGRGALSKRTPTSHHEAFPNATRIVYCNNSVRGGNGFLDMPMVSITPHLDYSQNYRLVRSFTKTVSTPSRSPGDGGGPVRTVHELADGTKGISLPPPSSVVMTY
jgi:hypothetical protein